MNKTKSLICLMLVMVLALTAIGLTACSDPDAGGETESGELEVATVETAKIGENSYGFTLQFANDEIVKTEKENFSMYVCSMDNAEESVADISDFTLVAAEDGSVDFAYVNKYAMDETNGVMLKIEAAALKSGEKRYCSINQQIAEYSLTADQTALNYYEGDFVLNLTLHGAVLTETVAKTDLTLEGLFSDAEYTLERLNEKTLKLTFSNAFANKLGTTGTIVLSANAIYGRNETSVSAVFPVEKKTAWIDSKSTQIIGKASGNQVVLAIAADNGVFRDISTSDFTVAPQESFSVSNVSLINENTALVSLSTALGGADLVAALNQMTLTLAASAANFGGESCVLTADFSSSLQVTAYDGDENEGVIGYTVHGSLKNAKFNSTLADAISVTATGGTAVPFSVISTSESGFDIRISTAETAMDVTVNVASSAVIPAVYHEGDYTEDTTLVHSDETRFALEAFLIEKAQGALKSILGAAEGYAKNKISSFLTPKIYSLLGIEQKPTITLGDISRKIEDVANSLESLRSDVASAKNTIINAINVSKYEQALSGYDTDYTMYKQIVIDLFGAGYSELLRLEAGVAVNGEITAEGLQQLESGANSAAYAEARNSFISYFESQTTAPKILTFGNSLVVSVAGLSGGYFAAYWNLMQSYYMFDSQCITMMENFYTSTVSVYTLAANMALRYYQLKGLGEASIVSCLNSMKAVSDGLAPYETAVKAAKERVKNGKTMDFVLQRVVSLKTEKPSIQKGVYINKTQNIEYYVYDTCAYTLEEWQRLVAASNQRSISLWAAMADAGFTGFKTLKASAERLDVGKSMAIGIALKWRREMKEVLLTRSDFGPLNRYYYIYVDYIAITATKIRLNDNTTGVSWSMQNGSGLETTVSNCYSMSTKQRYGFLKTSPAFKDSVGNEITMYQLTCK